MRDPRARTTVLLLASTLVVMTGATVSPALPRILAAFSDAPGAALLVRLAATLPALSLALAAPLVGLATDRWGARRVLVLSILAFSAFGGVGLIVTHLAQLLAARVFLGVALAGVMTAATTLIADLYRGAERTRYLGLQAAVMAASGLGFVLAGGFLADLHWRAPFGVFLLALPLAPLARRLLPAASPAAPAAEERGVPEASEVWTGRLLLLLAMAVLAQLLFMLLPVQLPFVLDRRVGASGGASGGILGAMTLASALSAVVYPRLRARFEPPVILAASLAAVAVALALLAGADSWAALAATAVLFGLAFGPIRPNLHVWAAEMTPPGRRGRVMGGVETGVFLGQFASPIVAMPLIEAVGYPGLFLAASGVALAGAAALARVAAGRVSRSDPAGAP